MSIAAIEREVMTAAAAPCRRVIDLGNGVMFPVDNEEEAEFVEWMVEEAKAGRASLPKRVPKPRTLSPNVDGITRKDWWPDYEYARSERF